MDNFNLKKYLAEGRLFKEETEETLPEGFFGGEEEFVLHLKNDRLDKKIKIDFDPITLFGSWDEEELKDILTKERVDSGTSLELIDSSNKVIKTGSIMGFDAITRLPIIRDEK